MPSPAPRSWPAMREFFGPLPLAAVALLAVNDHVLKARWPGLVTGKLSDVAGCFLLPLFLVRVERRERRSRKTPPRPRRKACAPHCDLPAAHRHHPQSDVSARVRARRRSDQATVGDGLRPVGPRRASSGSGHVRCHARGRRGGRAGSPLKGPLEPRPHHQVRRRLAQGEHLSRDTALRREPAPRTGSGRTRSQGPAEQLTRCQRPLLGDARARRLRRAMAAARRSAASMLRGLARQRPARS